MKNKIFKSKFFTLFAIVLLFSTLITTNYIKASCFFWNSPNYINLSMRAGSTESVSFSTTTSWYVTSGSDLSNIRVSQMSGKGAGKYRLYLTAARDLSSPRCSTINIYCGGSNHTIYIEQR